MLLSGRRATTEQAFGPLGGNRVPTVYSAKKSPTDSRVGVGVSAAHDRVHHGFLQVLRMGKLPEDVAERRQNPARSSCTKRSTVWAAMYKSWSGK